MKVINPITITDSMLTSSTVAENDYPAWASGTFAIGDRRIRPNHRIYECIKAHTGVSTLPENDAINWLDIGPTNRWAMFDNVVGTATSGASPLTVVMKPGSISGLGLLELVGRQAKVTMKAATGGAVVYDKTVDLDGTVVESFFDWFFNEFEQRTDAVLTDLPAQFANCELTVTVTTTSGNAEIGVCKPGKVVEIGDTLAGAKVGIADYSGKERDTFGNTYIVERSYSKEGSFEVITDASRFNRVYRTLASLRARPVIYIGAEKVGYEPMLIYGFFKDFSMVVEYTTHHLCSLEIEGLI